MGKDILFVTDVSKTIDGVKVLDKVSFIMDHEDKIALMGDNELAHTTLFHADGRAGADEGTIKWGQTTTVVLLSQGQHPVLQGLRRQSAGMAAPVLLRPPSESYLRGFLGRMLFSGDDMFKPVKVLSGGEKVRCMLSRMMLSGANVLLLDQPTNHLDLESITALNNGLLDVKCNVILASHDHQMIQSVCNRVFDFTANGKLIDRRQSYDDYLAANLPPGYSINWISQMRKAVVLQREVPPMERNTPPLGKRRLSPASRPS